jgi:hypothetical protein
MIWHRQQSRIPHIQDPDEQQSTYGTLGQRSNRGSDRSVGRTGAIGCRGSNRSQQGSEHACKLNEAHSHRHLFVDRSIPKTTESNSNSRHQLKRQCGGFSEKITIFSSTVSQPLKSHTHTSRPTTTVMMAIKFTSDDGAIASRCIPTCSICERPFRTCGSA